MRTLRQQCFRIRGGVLDTVVRFVEHCREVVRTVLLQPGVTGVAHNREQPGAARLAMKTVKEFPGPYIRFLDHPFGVMRIPRQPACQIVRRIQMR